MIIHAQPGDIPALKELWQEAFGEEKEFMDSFFKEVFCPEHTLCEKEGQEIRAMLFMLPCSIGAENAWYFYALATKKAFRNKGCMAGLISRAMEEIKERDNGFVFLIPASEGLAAYYRRFGFEISKGMKAKAMKIETEGPGRVLVFPQAIENFCRKWKKSWEEESSDFSVCSTREAEVFSGFVPM